MATTKAFESILQVLDPNDGDEMAVQFRKDMQSHYQTTSNGINTITYAIERITDSIATLRTLSGIDGISYAPALAGNILQLISTRLGEAFSDVEVKEMASNSDRPIVGSPALYAQSIEVLMRAIWRRNGKIKAIGFIPGEEFHELIIQSTTPIFSASEKPAHYSDEDLKHSVELASFILQPYQCSIRIHDESLKLALPAKLASDSD